MQRLQHNIHWRHIAIATILFIICIPAVQPFTLGRMLLTDDGNLHLYRTIVLDHSLTYDAALWPRYSSALALGYGAPLFNYFPPTSYYLPRALHLLGLPFIHTFLASMTIYTYLAALGAFLLGRSWSSAAGGFICAVAYVYSPYWLFDAITRGTLSEVAGLAILPFTLWALHQLTQMHRRRDYLTAVLSVSLLVLSHNIVALHGAILISAYSLFLIVRKPDKFKTFVELTLVGVISVGITAFFWLPALTETRYTRIPGTTDNLSFVDPTRTLRPVEDVFAFPQTADPSQLNQSVPISLGWPQAILASLAVIVAIARKERRGIILFLGAISLIVIYLNLESSAPLWETLPLIGYSQFAWRTLSLPTLALALMTGIGTSQFARWLPYSWLKNTFYGVFTATMMIYAIPWLYTAYIDLQANAVIDAQAYELKRGELSLASYSEYLPAWTDGDLDSNQTMPQFEHDEVIARLDAPETVNVIRASWEGLGAEIDYDAAESATLVFNWLYMPGWVAQLDGELVVLEPTSSTGLISVTVPEGRHTLHISLQSTSRQQFALGISLLSLLLLIITIILWSRLSSQPTSWIAENTSTRATAITFGVVALGVFAFKGLVIDHSQSLFRSERFATGISASGINALESDFSGVIRLLGVITPETATSGDLGLFQLFWELNNEFTESNYQSLLYLIDEHQNVVLQTEPHPPGGVETTNWRPDFYVEDRILAALPLDLPPGTYHVWAALYDVEQQRLLEVRNADGNVIGDRVDIGSIEIIRSEVSAIPETSTLYQATGMRLTSIDGLPAQGQVGDEFNLRWQWQALETPSQNYRAQFVWLTDDGEVIAKSASAPLTSGYPLMQWQSGDVWQGHARLYIPANLASDDYQVGIQLATEDGPATKPGVIAEMLVTEPERITTTPTFETPSGTHWQNGIQLTGYTADENSQQVELVWQTSTALHTSLRLFVQVFEGESLVAVSDGVPVDFTRPTTGWSTNEYITTSHLFDLEAGNYKLHIGWYDPLTNQRVPLANGNDVLLLNFHIS